MRKVIVLTSIAAVAVLGTMYFGARTEAVKAEDSPAFQTLLTEAIARLEGAAEQVTAISVPDARADAMQTVSEYTCSGFRTCDAIPTCDGSYTCNGEETCWASTCTDAATCECGCEQYTLEGGETCDGTATCAEGCPGWPTYFAGWPTCMGEPTCALTCPGYVSCAGGGASGVESTTWGQIKTEFTQ
jgi:hypothetical protein